MESSAFLVVIPALQDLLMHFQKENVSFLLFTLYLKPSFIKYLPPRDVGINSAILTGNISCTGPEVLLILRCIGITTLVSLIYCRMFSIVMDNRG